MNDRHLHCVYFQYDDHDNVKGYCLLKQKDVEYGYYHCCERVVLRPVEILSYFLKYGHYCEDWECADQKALDFLDRYGFNTYPIGGDMDEE